ncbi:(d)CMP kinase, partial [Streptococcus danieliae]|nr:(d)CMP kinase [Streptococcus danieliae]
ITTVVAPDADARVLLTASEEVRMARRGLQLGGTQSSSDLQKQVVQRDAKDSKVNNFTEAAEGVALVDSSDLDFDQTIAAVIAAVEKQI